MRTVLISLLFFCLPFPALAAIGTVSVNVVQFENGPVFQTSYVGHNDIVIIDNSP